MTFNFDNVEILPGIFADGEADVEIDSTGEPYISSLVLGDDLIILNKWRPNTLDKTIFHLVTKVLYSTHTDRINDHERLPYRCKAGRYGQI